MDIAAIDPRADLISDEALALSRSALSGVVTGLPISLLLWAVILWDLARLF